MTAMAAEGTSLISCNLPPRQSVSEMEPSRMSYYSGNEYLAVPFKWEAAPGMSIVEHSSQAGHQESGRLLLRPSPSASNFPVYPFVPASSQGQQKSDLLPKSRSRSTQEFMLAKSRTTADSCSAHQRACSKVSMDRRYDFDSSEVSDDEYRYPRRTDAQEPHASSSSTLTGQSFSSTSFSSASMWSQTPSPASAGDDGRPRAEGCYKRDLLALSNLVNFSAALAVETPCSGGSSESTSTAGSEDSESDSSETDDHVRPLGFLSCMPMFSRVLMIQQSIFGDKRKSAVIKLSQRLTPGSRNKGYRPNKRQSL